MSEPDLETPRQQEAALERLLRELEVRFLAQVKRALDDVAERFTALLTAAGPPIDATDTARIIDLWAVHTPELANTLADMYVATAASTVSRFAPGQATGLVEALRDAYLLQATNRMGDVGEALWAETTRTLADGNLAGEGYDALRDRLRETFSEGGRELGETRANRIARTEVQSAVNRGTLDGARALPAEVRPTFKTWVATLDARTRDAHAQADGQTVLLDERFEVDGELLEYPGDPAASPGNVINCRCTHIERNDADALDDAGRQSMSDAEIQAVLDDWEERGIVRANDQPGELAAADKPAAADGFTGAMLALVPSDADLDRLTLDGGEEREQLHLTLMFLGEAADLSDDVVAELHEEAVVVASQLNPIDADAFAAAMFNPEGEHPCWVLTCGGDTLAEAHLAGVQIAAVPEGWAAPEQHQPWAPHVTLIYSDDRALVDDVTARCGPVTLDCLRLAIGGAVTDYPLGATLEGEDDEGDTMSTEVSYALATPDQIREWLVASNTETKPEITFSTARIRGATLVDIPAFIEARIQIDGPPDDQGMQPWSGTIAVEGIPTGDARLFLPDAFRWEDPGDGWPLRWDVEDDGMHLGAVTVGTIHEMERDGDFIRGRGVFDTNIPNGEAAAGLVERKTVTGISVDLDDIPEDSVEIEFLLSAGLAVVGEADLPLEDRDVEWDGGAAASATLEWATDDDGNVDASRLSRAFFWRDDEADAETLSAYSLGFAQPGDDGVLRAVPRGIFAVAGVLQGARGGPDIPSDDQDQIRGRVNAYYAKMREEFDDDSIVPPWDEDAAGDSIEAAAIGSTEIPLAEEDTEWDPDDAHERLVDWFTDADGNVALENLAAYHLYVADDADLEDPDSYEVPFGDIVDGETLAVPAGIDWAVEEIEARARDDEAFAEDVEQMRETLQIYLERLAADDDEEENEDELIDEVIEASAWQEFRALPPLPATAFRDPSAKLGDVDEYVHYENGMIFGWVAQDGVCHEAFSGACVTPPKRGTDLDTFNRQPIELDDGTTLRVGVFTMDAGHDNDGADARDIRAQFDDTRTVAGLVHVGVNDRGTWFAGVAAPWLSDWDRRVLTTCRPSGHWRRLRSGRWSLRAVLSVPVPGYPTRVAASALVDRSNLALVASAAQGLPNIKAETIGELHIVVSNAEEESTEVEGDRDILRTLAALIVDEMEAREEIKQEVEELAASLNGTRALVANRLSETDG